MHKNELFNLFPAFKLYRNILRPRKKIFIEKVAKFLLLEQHFLISFFLYFSVVH